MIISLFKKIYSIIKLFNRKSKKINWHNLRNLKPISKDFGWSRGKPIDRFYIEQFLSSNINFIKGDCGEISEKRYLNMFDNDLIKSSKIFDIDHNNKSADIYGNLENIDNIPQNLFDCFICTQVLNFVYDYSTASKSLFKMLKPNGILLLTVSGPSTHISEYDMVRWGDYWRFTEKSILKNFEEIFGKENIQVKSYGNVLSAISMMQGIASEELSENEITFNDPLYPIIISVIAKKI